MIRDFRYIFKRVIIGILIGLFFIMFKSCNVNAIAITNKNVNIYSQTQNCDLDSENNLSCTKGLSYVFPYSSGSTNLSDIDMPFFLPNEHNILVSNLIFDVDLGEEYIIDNNIRSIYLILGNQSWFSSNLSLGPSNYRFTLNMFPTQSEASNNILPSVYGFKAFYCSYFDTVSQTTKTCNVKYGMDSNSNVFKVIPIFDLGTKLNRFTISFGTTDLYSGSTKLLCNVRVPNSQTFINSQCSSSNISYKYYVLYDTWRSVSLENYKPIGLFYYNKGTNLTTPKFKLPNYSSFLSYDNYDYSNYTFGATFDNYTLEEKEKYNDLVNTINKEIYGEFEVDDVEANISEMMGSFADNENSQRYLSTLESLLAYPIQKLQEQSSFDLVNYNVWTDSYQIDNRLCWGNDLIGDQGQPYQVQFWRDYKFTLPCLHSQVYTKLGYSNFGFYPSNFMGSNNIGYNYNFISIWLVLQHGLLVYLLFVNVLNLYKYILDSKKSEIEVLEL